MNEAMAGLVAEAVKKHGPNALFQASTRVPNPRWPSGSISLDVAMGGGWPTNVWTEVAGYPSSGKTALIHKTIAVNQQADPDFEVLWVAVEDYDEAWARTLGVDTDRVMIFEGHEMSKVYDLMAAATASKAFNMIILDSLPALMPDEEGEKLIGDAVMSPGARLTGRFFRKARITRNPDGSERPMLGVFINQWREKPGAFAPHGNTPKTRPGGLAKDHAYALRVEVVRAEDLIEELPGRGKRKVGQTLKATTAKNKTAAPGRVASVDFYFADAETSPFRAGDYDVPKELAMMGVLTEAIHRAGAYYTVGSVKVKGRDGLLDLLRGDLTAQQELAAEIRRRTLGGT